jgi:hypothetical protein
MNFEYPWQRTSISTSNSKDLDATWMVYGVIGSNDWNCLPWASGARPASQPREDANSQFAIPSIRQAATTVPFPSGDRLSSSQPADAKSTNAAGRRTAPRVLAAEKGAFKATTTRNPFGCHRPVLSWCRVAEDGEALARS